MPRPPLALTPKELRDAKAMEINRRASLFPDDFRIGLYGFSNLTTVKTMKRRVHAQDLPDILFQIAPQDISKIYFLLRQDQEWAREMLEKFIWGTELDETDGKNFYLTLGGVVYMQGAMLDQQIGERIPIPISVPALDHPADANYPDGPTRVITNLAKSSNIREQLEAIRNWSFYREGYELVRYQCYPHQLRSVSKKPPVYSLD